MDEPATHADEHQAQPHKPKHLAEKYESWIVVGMGIAGLALLVVLIWAFMQTGTGTPPWMK